MECSLKKIDGNVRVIHRSLPKIEPNSARFLSPDSVYRWCVFALASRAMLREEPYVKPKSRSAHPRVVPPCERRGCRCGQSRVRKAAMTCQETATGAKGGQDA